jgi:hypothetical protein
MKDEQEAKALNALAHVVYDDVMKLCHGKNIGAVVTGLLTVIMIAAEGQCDKEHCKLIAEALRATANKIEGQKWR